MAAYHWVDNWSSEPPCGCYCVPSTAIPGGEDVDGHQIFVGRAYFRGDWLPAKVIPGRRRAYVAFAGKEHSVDRYQVLCEQRFDWVESSGDKIPTNAVEAGRTSKGEPLYIGRVYHEGSHTVGKVHASYKRCFIPFDGKEVAYTEYEILVLRS